MPNLDGEQRERILHWLWRILKITILVGGLAFCAYVSGDRNFGQYYYQGGDAAVWNLPYRMPAHIALVGDGWTAEGELAAYLQEDFANRGYAVEVTYQSWPGARSGEITAHLRAGKNPADGNARSVLYSDADMVMLIAGGNDAGQHIGADYYASSMCRAVEAIASVGKMPAVVEVPNYTAPSDKGLSDRARLAVYRLIFDGGKLNTVMNYREAFLAELEKSGLPCLVIPFAEAAQQGMEDKALLAECIATELIESLNEQNEIES